MGCSQPISHGSAWLQSFLGLQNIWAELAAVVGALPQVTDLACGPDS